MRTLDVNEMEWCGGLEGSMWGCIGAAIWVIVDLILIGVSEGSAGIVVGGFFFDNVAMISACLYSQLDTEQ